MSSSVSASTAATSVNRACARAARARVFSARASRVCARCASSADRVLLTVNAHRRLWDSPPAGLAGRCPLIAGPGQGQPPGSALAQPGLPRGAARPARRLQRPVQQYPRHHCLRLQRLAAEHPSSQTVQFPRRLAAQLTYPPPRRRAAIDQRGASGGHFAHLLICGGSAMRTRVFRRWFVVAVSAGVLVVAAGWPAAAAVPGWRLVRQFTVCNSDGALAVTATSASNAWAAGQWSRFTTGNCGPEYLLIAHWDGTSWSVLRSPAGYASDVGTAVATLSTSYAWAFVSQGFPPPPSAPGSALLWQNGTWRAFPLAGGAQINSAVVFSRSNAWGFGERFPTTGPVAAYAVHFNGQGWSAISVPVLPQGTASPAPDNIWAVGPLASATGQPIPQPYALAHWTGSQWQTIPFPPLHLPKGEGVTDAWVVSDGAQGAWVAGDVRNRSSSIYRGVLLHWTGSTWDNVTIPFQTPGLGPLSSDGHGGLWINCCLDKMAHYSGSRWLPVEKVAIPVGEDESATAMRLIPGTSSVWASVIFVSTHDGSTSPGILKYGP